MEKEKVYLDKGLIHENREDGVLAASKCIKCGTVYFPQRAFCPECHESNLQIFSLPDEGRLYTYTVVNMPSAHYNPPYTIGWVEFSDEVRVFGLIDIEDTSGLQIGMRINVGVDTLWENEKQEYIAYKFKPVFE